MPENRNQLNEIYQENNAFFNDPNPIQMRQNLGVRIKNYHEINKDQNHINSAPSNKNQVHRRTLVFVEVNNDEKKRVY